MGRTRRFCQGSVVFGTVLLEVDRERGVCVAINWFNGVTPPLTSVVDVLEERKHGVAQVFLLAWAGKRAAQRGRNEPGGAFRDMVGQVPDVSPGPFLPV